MNGLAPGSEAQYAGATMGEGTTPGLGKSATRPGRGRRRKRGQLKACRHRGRDADVARNPPQARALDLDLGQTGLVEQQGEFTNERTVVAFEFLGWFVVRLRAIFDPELSVSGKRTRQAFALTPILAARPVIGSR